MEFDDMHGSPTFYKLLEEMAVTHDKKSHDYASDDNPFGNYLFAGQMACMFAHSPNDAGFVGRLAEKIYRIANLESGNKEPNNESISDTERDIAVITLLWIADRRTRRLALNNRELNQFRGDSRSILNQFFEVIGKLTPEDLEHAKNLITEVILRKHGITTLSTETKQDHPK